MKSREDMTADGRSAKRAQAAKVFLRAARIPKMTKAEADAFETEILAELEAKKLYS